MTEHELQRVNECIELAIARHREAMREELRREFQAHRDNVEQAVENKLIRLSGKGVLWLAGVGLTTGAIGSAIKGWLLAEIGRR